MNIVKRGLIALAVTAAVGGTAGSLLATAASASSPPVGLVVIHVTQLFRRRQETVPGHGSAMVRSTPAGNITDAVPSYLRIRPTASRHLLVDPTGSFTVLAHWRGPTRQALDQHDDLCVPLHHP